jgi:hypothetical protein
MCDNFEDGRRAVCAVFFAIAASMETSICGGSRFKKRKIYLSTIEKIEC